MNARSSFSPIDEYRVHARRLLKDLRSEESGRRESAARRFGQLGSFAGAGSDELARPDRVRLKHALAVIAAEHGWTSWTELKTALASSQIDESTLMYDRGFDVLLNRWFADYTQAQESLREMGGYLLPYRKQFVICESEAIRLLGLDPDDSDWARIGSDFCRPADREAWRRLRDRRVNVLLRSQREDVRVWSAIWTRLPNPAQR